MRVRLDPESSTKLFSRLEENGYTLSRLAQILSVSSRTVFDWRRNKYTIPTDSYDELLGLSGLTGSDLQVGLMDDWSHASRAGRLGGRAVIRKYGTIGTTESRRLGGRSSYIARKENESDIFARSKIRTPDLEEDFAEFMGIMIGDGNITKYQVSIALSSLVDAEYCIYVAGLAERLFNVPVKITKRDNANCLVITLSSVNLVTLLNNSGLPRGNKVKQNHTIPTWILSDQLLTIACLRGIFDTDGCIFLERHGIKGKLYCYPRLSFVSASAALREAIYDALYSLGFEPRIRNNRSVNLEVREDINHYFRLVGTSNPKHAERFNNFGGVG